MVEELFRFPCYHHWYMCLSSTPREHMHPFLCNALSEQQHFLCHFCCHGYLNSVIISALFSAAWMISRGGTCHICVVCRLSILNFRLIGIHYLCIGIEMNDEVHGYYRHHHSSPFWIEHSEHKVWRGWMSILFRAYFGTRKLTVIRKCRSRCLIRKTALKATWIGRVLQHCCSHQMLG